MEIFKILLTEDNAAERYLLRPYLEAENFSVFEAETAASALKVLEREKIDGILLDLNLPDEDGLALLRKIRATSSVPVIAVTARQDEKDRITGLELGADDYLGKPYHPRELILRLEKLLRRNTSSSNKQVVYYFGNYTLDIDRRILSDMNGEKIVLTPGEFHLLAALTRAKGRILSREQLLDAMPTVNGNNSRRTIDVLVSRIRQKIESIPNKPVLLCTEKGIGYKLSQLQS